MHKNRHFLGIILALTNAFMLATMSLFAKMLSSYFGAIDVTFFRNVFSLLALFIFLAATGKLAKLKTRRPWAHLFRGTIGTIGIVSGMWALSMMPLAETTILLFTSPLFVVLLSYPVLGEKVGPYRLGAVLTGFIGVIVALQPSHDVTALPLLGIIAGLLWGFFAGCVDLCLRWIGKTENATATTFYFVLLGTVTTGLHIPFAAPPQNGSTLEILLIICGLGLSGLLSLLAKTQSFKFGEAAFLSPIMYTMIFWTMIFDYVLLDKWPSTNMIYGSALIIASNIFILYRQNRVRISRTKTHTSP